VVGAETTTHEWSETTRSQLGPTPTDHVGRILQQGARLDCNEAIRKPRNDVTFMARRQRLIGSEKR